MDELEHVLFVLAVPRGMVHKDIKKFISAHQLLLAMPSHICHLQSTRDNRGHPYHNLECNYCLCGLDSHPLHLGKGILPKDLYNWIIEIHDKKGNACVDWQAETRIALKVSHSDGRAHFRNILLLLLNVHHHLHPLFHPVRASNAPIPSGLLLPQLALVKYLLYKACFSMDYFWNRSSAYRPHHGSFVRK